MYDRKQGPSETFDDFYTAIQQMNSRLRSPKPDSELIELLKQNVRRRMGELLITFQTDSLPEMVYVCRNIEKYSSDHDHQKLRSSYVPPPRRNFVSEVGYAAPSTSGSTFVEELPVRRDTRNYNCWNCKGAGHSFYECPDPQRALFCYRCGRENTTTPQCPKCSGNERRSNLASGLSCSRNKNPGSQ